MVAYKGRKYSRYPYHEYRLIGISCRVTSESRYTVFAVQTSNKLAGILTVVYISHDPKGWRRNHQSLLGTTKTTTTRISHSRGLLARTWYALFVLKFPANSKVISATHIFSHSLRRVIRFRYQASKTADSPATTTSFMPHLNTPSSSTAVNLRSLAS